MFSLYVQRLKKPNYQSTKQEKVELTAGASR